MAVYDDNHVEADVVDDAGGDVEAGVVEEDQSSEAANKQLSMLKDPILAWGRLVVAVKEPQSLGCASVALSEQLASL